MRTRVVLLLGAWACLGCVGAGARLYPPTTAPVGDRAALAAAAEAFYSAGDVATLRGAVEAARKVGPDTALYHELAAQLAYLASDEAAQFEHEYAALFDPGADATLFHLLQLDRLRWPSEGRVRVRALLSSLVLRHRDAEVRAAAAQVLARTLHAAGRAHARDRALVAAGALLRFAVVGGWDNDQGEGFDAVLPPEQRLDFRARYQGSLREIGWRLDPPRDPWGQLDLGEMLRPQVWAVAYAATGVRAGREGDYELRLRTTAPVKVWVNGSLVFQARLMKPSVRAADQFMLPIRLRAGANRILIKSAQKTGSWVLSARLTDPGGVPATGLEAVPPSTPPASGPPPGHRQDMTVLLSRRVQSLPVGARREFHRLLWAEMTGARREALAAAEGLVQRHPRSLVARYRLANELWDIGARERTADLLTTLDREAGDALPFLRLQQVRFWQQQGLRQKARDALLKVRAAHPDLPLALFRLAQHFQIEGWVEDQCATLEEASRRWPGWPHTDFVLGACLRKLGFHERSSAAFARVLQAMPGHNMAHYWIAQTRMRAGDFAGASSHAQRRVELFPHSFGSWAQLAEIRRRAGDRAGAEHALNQTLRICPDDAFRRELMGRIAWQAGDRAAAIAHWSAAVRRDPKNTALAHRLEFLAPLTTGPWLADVPNEAAIAAALTAGKTATLQRGADTLFLLDHEVTELGADGSTANVITLVARAVSERGRTTLTRWRVGVGQVRMLRAYAVDDAGKKAEASIRGRDIRFRGLKVHSSVVLQYRQDVPPMSYLPRHLGKEWWFQSSGRQNTRSELVLWAPLGARLHEARTPAIRRAERVQGGQRRIAWTAERMPPIVSEPMMPPLQDVAAHLLVSTVPDWETFLKWEAALLEGTFREDPAVVALADRLFAGAADAHEKLVRLQVHVAGAIRYQQDYENHIAGVKPHPAPTVIERGYGDCKDKAVLFITLARRAGIDAHFALLRTRNAGAVRQDVPMQQFDHAIVYVPAQAGLAEGRFYDPTADMLDVGVVPPADAGAMALVYDPKSGQHAWRRIPYASPGEHQTRFRYLLALERDGAATGELEVNARGEFASMFRRLGRNPEHLAQFLQRVMGATFPGATKKEMKEAELKDLRRPIVVRAGLRAPAVGRREGSTLRFNPSVTFPLSASFSLAERKFPLELGVPATYIWRYEVALPHGAVVTRLPASARVEARCLTFERKTGHMTSGVVGRIVIEQRIETRCPQIAVDEYGAHRARVDEIQKLVAEDVVLDVAKDR